MGVWPSIVFQELAPDTSIFALFVSGTVGLLPMPSKSKLLIYPLALVLMLFGLHIAAVDSVATLHTSINAACVCIAALLIEAVLMKSCASDFAQSEQFEFQARKTTALLSKSLPATVIDRLKESDETVVELHPEVSVLFVDFAGFNKITESLEPEETIGLLGALFQEFDEAAVRFGVEKIKASGDTYMAASGVTEYQANHAERVASLALRIRAIAQRFRSDRGQPVHFRLGIDSGPIIAGVIGRKRFCYDLWGETVNTARLLQASSALVGIHVSAATRNALGPKFSFSQRAPIRIRGRAPVQTYYLVGRAVDRDSVNEAIRLQEGVELGISERGAG